jgi:hypothetical protein
VCGPCHGGTSAQRDQRGCSCGRGIHAYDSGDGCLVEMCASRRSLSDVSSQRPGGNTCPDGHFLWTDRMRLRRARRVSQPPAPGTSRTRLAEVEPKRPIGSAQTTQRGVVLSDFFPTVGLFLTTKRQPCKLFTPPNASHPTSVRPIYLQVFVPFPTCYVQALAVDPAHFHILWTTVWTESAAIHPTTSGTPTFEGN